MKFTDKSFLHYFSYVLMVASMYLLARGDIHEYIAYALLALSVILTLGNLYIKIKVRAADLEVYAGQNGFDFLKIPNQDQIDEFLSFKSVKTVADKNHFINILVPKDFRISNRALKPKIITGTKEKGGEYSQTYFTQIFLYEINEMLPLFYLSSRGKFLSFMPVKFGAKLSQNHINSLNMKNYQKIEIDNYDFPVKSYDLYSPNLKAQNLMNIKFIELLNNGIKKNTTVNIESTGNKIIFFIRSQRHSEDGLDFYTNLFNVMIKTLTDKS
jgi:hypothetical protein